MTLWRRCSLTAKGIIDYKDETLECEDYGNERESEADNIERHQTFRNAERQPYRTP